MKRLPSRRARGRGGRDVAGSTFLGPADGGVHQGAADAVAAELGEDVR